MKSEISKVCVVGLGYIGLPTAAVLATRGVDVIGLEVNQSVIDTINKGEIHIVEPGLDVVVKSAVHSKKLRATSVPETADVYLIAVPTPFKENHEPDLTYVESAARALAPVLKKGDLIVLESTSPVGTTDQMVKWLREIRSDLTFPVEGTESYDIYVAYCPERVLPGHVLRELIENDRVIGGINGASSERAQKFYKMFVEGACIVTNARTAEMVKLTENSFRDVNIAFANELSLLCDRFNISVWELIQLANRHPRVKILKPGPGVGGHCISVDPWFLVSAAPEQARLIRTAREVNDGKPQYVIELIKKEAAKFKNPKIACLGLAFKPDIDDLRESPAVEIVNILAASNVGEIFAVEPHIEVLPARVAKEVHLLDVTEALAVADIVVVLVSHRDFKSIDRSLFNQKILLDSCGCFT